MSSSRRQCRFAAVLLAQCLLLTGVARAEELGTSTPAEPPRKWLAVSLGLGFALGGDDLLHVEFDSGDDTTLSAGNGFVADLGVLAMPLWFGPVALGAAVDIGIKYAGIEASNGSASFTRFPLVVAGRGMVRVSN